MLLAPVMLIVENDNEAPTWLFQNVPSSKSRASSGAACISAGSPSNYSQFSLASSRLEVPVETSFPLISATQFPFRLNCLCSLGASSCSAICSERLVPQ